MFSFLLIHFTILFSATRIIATPMKICLHPLSCWDAQYYIKFADSIHYKIQYIKTSFGKYKVLHPDDIRLFRNKWLCWRWNSIYFQKQPYFYFVLINILVLSLFLLLVRFQFLCLYLKSTVFSLTLYWMLSTKRSYILKQTCSSKLQVCLSLCDLLVDTRH